MNMPDQHIRMLCVQHAEYKREKRKDPGMLEERSVSVGCRIQRNCHI